MLVWNPAFRSANLFRRPAQHSPRGLLAMLLPLVIVATACGSHHATPAAVLPQKPTTSAGAATGPVPGGDVAIVGDEPITKTEVDALIAEFRAVNKSEHKPFPKQGTPAFKVFQDDAVDYFVRGAALEQQARKELGIEITDSAVKASIAKIRDDAFAGSRAKMLKHFASLGINQKQLENFQRLQLAEDELPGILARRAHLKVSTAAARAYYVQHKAHYAGKTFPQAKFAIDAVLLQQQTNALVQAWVARMAHAACGKVRYQSAYHPDDLVCDST
jgi:hypothetical protein